MTTTPPSINALKIADELDCHNASLDRKASKAIRLQHERLTALEAEILEQARMNGMGAEREAALMGKVECLESEQRRLQEALLQIADPRRATQEPQNIARTALEAIVQATKEDASVGAYDLAAGKFGPTFTAMNRRLGEAETQNPSSGAFQAEAVHPISGMTADDLWMENGRLRAQLADLKANAKVQA